MEALLKGIKLDYLARCDFAKTGRNWLVFLPASSLVRAAERLLKADYFIEDVTAVDCAEGYVVVYHFDHFESPGRVALKVIVPHDKPVVPSIAGLFDGAEWHERETRDFHGVIFEGNPNFVPLLIDPDMADCFPLRKDPKSRAAAGKIMAPGEALFCDPAFTLFAAEAPAAESAGEAK